MERNTENRNMNNKENENNGANEFHKNSLSLIKKVQLSIATHEDIISWSSGEVTKPETINYKSYRAESQGLFDEKIFGPIKDFRCPICRKKHKKSDVGKPCTSCGETIIESKMIRRRRMGHIKLAENVIHIWFMKVNYSAIKTLLEMKQADFKDIVYFKSYVIYNAGNIEGLKNGTILNIQNAASIYRKIFKALIVSTKNKEIIEALNNKLNQLIGEATQDAGQSHGIDFNDYNEFIERVSNVRIGTGASGIKELLELIDIDAEAAELKKKFSIKAGTPAEYRRYGIVKDFQNSGQKPSLMVLDTISVIPPDLRPLIQLDGGRHSTVDANELYRRVIIRNNRLKQWTSIGAPTLIVQNEKRMLQESVDALFDNERKAQPVLSKDNRPLKSLTDNLKGKQGRFRQNLLGKRVDYSGRSVIVVGPHLKLHQVGLPKEMIAKLFEPFIVNKLVENGIVFSIKQAKKMVDFLDDRIWKYANEVIQNYPVLLNRAPTLHRLSIQAFEPVISPGKAIQLHPLVTPAFNADFDGDQMAVHLPIKPKSKEEASTLMLASKNVLGPKDGKLILTPSQDMVLGLYYLTKINTVKEIRVMKNIIEINNFISQQMIKVHDVIALSLKDFDAIKFKTEIDAGYKYIVTTVGRALLNKELKSDFPYINEISQTNFMGNVTKYMAKSASELKDVEKIAKDTFAPFKKGGIHKIIEYYYESHLNTVEVVLDYFKDLGFHYSMMSGTSVSMSDIIEPANRTAIIDEGQIKINGLLKMYQEGFLTDDERYLQVLKIWANVKDNIQKDLEETLKVNKDNSLFMMMDSGARGNISNFVQLAGMRGLMAKITHEYAAFRSQNILVRSTEEHPILSSFKIGLKPFEYFLSTHGARKGLSDTATKTAESGYLTRRLVEASQDVKIIEDDCNTTVGIISKDIHDTRTNSVIETLFERIVGRYLSSDLIHDGKVLLPANSLITEQIANNIESLGIKEVEIRSPLTCSSRNGICKKCYGVDLTTTKPVNVGEAVGIIAAQSIGEPGTQLTLRTFHTGGVAGVADITQGFSRLMELVDASKNPKGQSKIATIEGEVTLFEANEVDKKGKPINYKLVISNELDEEEHIISANNTLRVRVGSKVVPGSKITEGSIQLQQLLDVAGTKALENYLLKEIQKLYRLQGLEINDKYIEIIISRMLSMVQIIDAGSSNFYKSQIISEEELLKTNEQLFNDGLDPVMANPLVIGVKTLPLLYNSFLSAASYQRTADVLTKAAIAKQVDVLTNIKDNLIIGKLIPLGTGISNPQGKYKMTSPDSIHDLLNDFDNIDLDESDNFNNDINVVNQ